MGGAPDALEPNVSKLDSPIVGVNTFWSFCDKSASTTPGLYTTVKPTNGLCRDITVMDIYLTGIMAAAIENKEKNKETSLRVHCDSVLSVSQEPRDGFQHTSGLVNAACLVPVSAVSAVCWADSKKSHQCTLGSRHPLWLIRMWRGLLWRCRAAGPQNRLCQMWILRERPPRFLVPSLVTGCGKHPEMNPEISSVFVC